MLGKHLVYLDSFQFMSSSCDRLASNLPDAALKYTSEGFQDNEFKLMKKKGLYSRDYMNSFREFDDKLPGKMISTAFFKMNIYLMSNTIMLTMCGIHSISVHYNE